jgi:hypothetical protein
METSQDERQVDEEHGTATQPGSEAAAEAHRA